MCSSGSFLVPANRNEDNTNEPARPERGEFGANNRREADNIDYVNSTLKQRAGECNPLIHHELPGISRLTNVFPAVIRAGINIGFHCGRVRAAEINKYPKIAPNFGPDSRRGKGRTVVLCNPFRNAEKSVWNRVSRQPRRGSRIDASNNLGHKASKIG